ncbi:MAG: thiamine-phosphate kinase, partial [Candidatus Omnitrophica bacterium]|nr:thiamine-phosphate kinase [Candidatus Omnitrophota bacterium]
DVDFKLKDAAAFQIGWKSLACGLSDIASMGGIAKYAVVSLGLPKKLGVEFIDEVYRGIKALAGRFNVEIVGGDTNSSGKLVIDVAVLGFVEPDKAAFRSGARPGDIICVTGALGGSYKSKRHLVFTPRLKEARYLVNNFKITSMIDISDGLSTDLNHIAKESGAGACIYEELIPVSKGARGVNAALNEGEDFELLFTMPLAEARRLARKNLELNGVRISQIGEMLDKKIGVKIIAPDGKTKDLKPEGFSHF